MIILYGNKNEEATGTSNNVNDPHKHQKGPDTKGYTQYGFIYTELRKGQN